MTAYQQLKSSLKSHSHKWLITGAAGFIGSNLLETLLRLDQQVAGLDNFGTGNKKNLDEVKGVVTPEQWNRFQLIEGDIRNEQHCRAAVKGVEFVLHQAALGSVPLSLANPALCHETNVTGFLNILIAARDAKVRRVVYASSSSVYGDDASPAKIEGILGKPLSPYAASKLMNEIYAGVFSQNYSMDLIGLRYFNVFGPRQNPAGQYAAVIPTWIEALLRKEQVFINGDGETSRDFCFIENVVQANLLAAFNSTKPRHEVYNIGSGKTTTLNQLFGMLSRSIHNGTNALPRYQAFREGDVRHSLADIAKSRSSLGYEPSAKMEEELERTIKFFELGRTSSREAPLTPKN